MRIATEDSGPRRVWSETVPFAELRDPAVQQLIAQRGIELIAAVRPGQEDDAARLVAAAREKQLRLRLWPMLDDADGRWASVHTAEAFTAFAQRVLDLGPDGLALDLEPPLSNVRALLRGSMAALRRRQLPRGGPLHRLCADARARGVDVLAAVVPVVLADAVPDRGWQRALGTPLPAVDRVSAMLYTSLATGYSRGALRRQDARALLHAAASACRRRFAHRAAASVGAVGLGALGDERVLAGPEQLADDVGVCRAAGIDDVALLDLGGVLRRGPPEPWLDALCLTPPARCAPPPTSRARAVIALTVGLSAVLR